MSGYAFLDCGDGRRLERFGGVTVSRPAPAAVFGQGLPPDEWARADASFERGGGWRGGVPADWRVELGGVTLGLRLGEGGQVGVFPEHRAVCDVLCERAAALGEGVRALNLFAHTGQATLRLAALGAEAAHVDAAAAAVRRARENAALSGLGDRPVRWLVDDALGFMRRAARRGEAYDIVVADPPAFGRGGKGGEWKLERDLGELLELAARLLARDGAFLCLTCHREGWGTEEVSRRVREVFGGGWRVEGRELELRSECGGNGLPAGCMVTAGR